MPISEEMRKILEAPAKPLSPEMAERVDQHMDDSLILLVDDKPVKGKTEEA
jgi:hypothetical protein